MFPINTNRLTVSQSTEFPTSSNTNHLPERIKSIQNISELSPHLTGTKLVKRNRPKLKLNIEAATQTTVFDKLTEKTQLLMNEKNIEYDSESRGQRYPNIGSAKQTQISVLNPYKSIVTLAANRLRVGNENLAIRCQYPKDNDQAIENHLSMLMANKTPILVVLASKQEIHGSVFQKDKLPPYFMSNQKYGAIEVSVRREKKDYKVEPKQINAGEKSLEFSQYKMDVFNGHKKHSIPVIHVTNWDDGGTVTTEELIKLNRIIGTINEGSLFELYKNQGVDIEGGRKPLPVIHCKAGIGRTGVLAASMQWMKAGNKLGMEDIVLGLRETGNPNMVQNEEQYRQLRELTSVPLSPIKTTSK
ncbi:TPA: tyrosine protein phosphatase [Providencia alcalifaciens]|nr:tyrosine protein phosphatase [Providencia alcalifaciens]